MSGNAACPPQLLEIQSRAEHRICAGEDDNVDVVVALGIGQGPEKLIPQRCRQCIAGLRSVER
jgi:hypothetical protein